MKAAITRDQTVRTIQIDVTGVPDVNVTQSWHRKARFMRPEHVRLTIVNGDAATVTVTGGLVLKSGGASGEVREKFEWRTQSYHSNDHIDHAPDWVRRLWVQAPLGVTSWNEPEAQTL